MIQFGLRLHDAEKLPIEQVLPLVHQKGFSCVHLALSKSLKEVPNTPSALTPGYAAYLRRLFAKNELDIAVLGNYLNLAHPDADALHAIQEKYYAHIRFASLLGCGMVGTETGAPNAEYKFCPECRSDAALATFIKNFKPVVRCAEQYGVTIAIEPVVKHIVYDARRARTVLDEIGSPNLQILLDPVNLLNMENVDQREEVFAEAIELLGTVAFAISGAITAVEKGMDLCGVAVLGITTATGGGILRDLILGSTPPVAFRDPVYLLVAAGVSLLFFLPWPRRRLRAGR